MVRPQSNNIRTQTRYEVKFNNKNNKTVFKSENVAGKFTTIPHRIINDKRLSTDARLLLISILSDADNFDISRTGLMNRLGLSEYKLDKAFNELIEYGYLKKTKRHSQYFHYTVSEFGNLNNDSNVNNQSVCPEVSTAKSNEDEDYLNSQQYKDDITSLQQFTTDFQEYINFKLMSEQLKTIQCRDDIFSIKREQQKEIKKNKLAHYKVIEKSVNDSYARKNDKPKILKEIKRLIFEEHQRPMDREVDRIRTRISIKRNKDKVKKYGFDYETQLVDSYENPLD